jgi:hypothetical protein
MLSPNDNRNPVPWGTVSHSHHNAPPVRTAGSHPTCQACRKKERMACAFALIRAFFVAPQLLA